ncbi:hypothetical protein [Streptomyces sp. or3]|uniref:hypothetical protein n=1 Tax=Streptomyces sp. or3 TaxID=1828020 RepID=UPI000BFBC1EB|nr:hypothetical protein [Streptomyces sp. or3]
MNVTVYAMPRDEVLSYMGTDWPPTPGATVVRIDPAAGVTDGTVSVYETPGRPGISWWLVDGVIPPQGAGAGGEALAALISGAVAEYIPIPESESPPHSGVWSSSPE